MKSFKSFIIESVEDTEKLSHLEHAEDHVINAGEKGFHHATRTLIGVHHALLNHNTPVKVTTKYDGAPSLIFGTHPENKKFFVASKSAFNKNPKINYTHADIEKNHGHAPGLVHKLSTALSHLPKSTPKGKVYQGDIMHTKDDLKSDKSNYHFTPNTIKYSIPKNSETGKKVVNSKIGVAVHTEYKGDSFNNMKASFGPDTGEFKSHKDTHIMGVHTDAAKANYTPAMRVKFFSHINKAKKSAEGHDFSHLSDDDHKAHIKTYINHTVRQGTRPTVSGLYKHVEAKHEVMKSKVKTDKTKAAIDQRAHGQLEHINKHRDNISNTFKIHKHLQDAKHVLVKGLASADEYKHSIGGKETGPEGHVAFLGGKPTKLVDRSAGGFAASNMLAGGMKKTKKPK